MAKIIIVMISRLRTDPPFLAMSVAQVKKKKKSAEKYIDVSAPHRPLGVRCYTLRIPPSALTSMLNFFFCLFPDSRDGHRQKGGNARSLE